MRSNMTIYFLAIILLIMTFSSYSQVTDYDGNVYTPVTIGNQIWLKENLNSVHYSDGTPIPDVVSYNNSDSLGNIYGKLYTWDAAMRASTTPGVQGVCPCGYHVASDSDWIELENYLGGNAVAGGKMKVTGTVHWQSPNSGATNESGFSALPAGEYDGYYVPHKFQFLHTYAVFWTSTQVTQTKARERALSYNNTISLTYDWYKIMKYSIRCVQDEVARLDESEQNGFGFKLFQNFPNPFNPQTTILYSIPQSGHVKIELFDLLGRRVRILVDEQKPAGSHIIRFDAGNLSGNVYFYRLSTKNYTETRKLILLK